MQGPHFIPPVLSPLPTRFPFPPISAIAAKSSIRKIVDIINYRGIDLVR